MPVEAFSEFTLFRPVFLILLAAVVTNSIYLIFLQKRVRASHFIIFNSLLILVAAVVMFFQEGVIVSDLNLSGDGVAFDAILVMGILLTISLFSYLAKAGNKKTGSDS